MGSSRPLILHHPTTVVYVDDDGDLLHMLPSKVGVLPFRTFSDPQEVVEEFLAGELSSALDLRCLTARDSDSARFPEETLVGIDKWMIYMRLFQRRRFDLVSVLVVDYEMPGLSGLDLCRELQQFPCKKLMLTGRGGYGLAVQAFNDGLIDQYIDKSQPDLPTHVADAVRHLQRRFFAESTGYVAEILRGSDGDVWMDEGVWALFNQHCVDRGIVEHYLVTDPRGFLAVDAAGCGHLWLVYDDDEIAAQAQTARRLGAPDQVVARLQGRQSVVFAPRRDAGMVLDYDEWARALLPLAKVPGYTGRFYAVTEGTAPFELKPGAVTSLEDYMTAG